MGVWPMICKIPPYYQFCRSSSKTVTYLFYCGIELTRFYLFNEVVRPRWRGRGLAGCSSGEGPSGASSFPSTMCSGRYSGPPSVSPRRRGEVWSESPWGCSAIVDHSVESQCMIIELVSNL